DSEIDREMDEPALALAGALEENRLLREQLIDLFNWILTTFKGHVPLSESLVARLDLPVVNDEGVLHPDLETFLRITASERETINQALTAASEAIESLNRSALRIEFPDESRLVAIRPPYPEEGEKVRQRLLTDLDGALGIYRFDRFLRAAQKDLDRAFDTFGRSERTIEMDLTASPESGEEILRIRDQIRLPEEDGSVRTETREIATRNLPPDYRFLFSLPLTTEARP
ncbi:MAG: hypothetical protein U1E27_09380, partial [Kiritimatiellia bacterium]|nr:hypothetical protein [Kiritimatiellia bacterium]